jgi:hypothetical protein
VKVASNAVQKKGLEDSDVKKYVDGMKLTEEQRRSREILFCIQRHDRTSDFATIVVNVGLGCLAIRRFLQVRLFSTKNCGRSHI